MLSVKQSGMKDSFFLFAFGMSRSGIEFWFSELLKNTLIIILMMKWYFILA